MKNSIMYSKPNLRYGHCKMQQVLYIVFYSSNTYKNRNFEKLLWNCCTWLIICCLITLNEMLTCWKIQLCTVNKSWDMDILKCNKYCILCFIALMHVKIKILKTILKSLYMIDSLLFGNTNEMLTCVKIRLCTHNHRLDMDILKSDCSDYCVL